jgi:amino acid transporter
MGRGTITLWGAVAIGVGGMVGGGIFAVLGLSVELAGGGAPLAFLLAGVVALLTANSYVRLTLAFPSRGGTVTFLNQAFGPGVISGGLNVMLWLSYLVMLALYAQAFGSYGASFVAGAGHALARHLLLSGVVVAITALNVLGADVVGRAETLIVGLKVAILLLFVGAGALAVHGNRLAPATWTSPLALVAGGMIIFLAYEGFELIANAAEDVADARRTLPRAYHLAVGFVVALYVAVALVAIGGAPKDALVNAKDYALAVAARPSLGEAGFALIAAAAMLSTASAINASLYGAARVSFVIAQSGELPEVLERKVWHRPIEGLLITGVATLLLANLVPLGSVATVGSAGFLVIFTAVNVANARLASVTGARPAVALLAAAASAAALLTLLVETAARHPAQLWFLAALVALGFGGEVLYRAVSGRQATL